MSHADNLERQATALFRQAGMARNLAGQAQMLPDESIDRVYNEMQKAKRKGKGGVAEVVVAVDTDDGGKVN
jgi:hypothetical protein